MKQTERKFKAIWFLQRKLEKERWSSHVYADSGAYLKPGSDHYHRIHVPTVDHGQTAIVTISLHQFIYI